MRDAAPKLLAPTGAARTRFGEAPLYAEGLYDLGNGIFAWMVPNGSWGEANAGLVTGSHASLLIDTLWDPPLTRAMLAAMAPILARAPLTTLVNTHADGDHFWGNQLIEGAETITSAASRAEMNHHVPRAMLALERLGKVLGLLPFESARQAGHYFKSMCAPYAFAEVTHTPATRGFSGELELDVGGRLVRLIEVGPAHTQGDLMVHVPDARVLFTGDILFIGSTPVMWAGPVENWFAALDLILSLKADVIVPGHGPFTDSQGVRLVRTYWEFVVRETQAHFAKGHPPMQAARAIVASDTFHAQPFATWDSPERIVTNVHLLYRHLEGRTGPLSTPAKLNILRKQALLAHELPDASPRSMRCPPSPKQS